MRKSKVTKSDYIAPIGSVLLFLFFTLGLSYYRINFGAAPAIIILGWLCSIVYTYFSLGKFKDKFRRRR